MDLPGVGENLQDQPNNNFILQSTSTFNGTMAYAAFGSIADIFRTIPKFNISSWAITTSIANNNSIPVSSITQLFNIQYGLLNSGVPDAESIIGTTLNFGFGPSEVLASAYWLLMPFSRGNIHITSSDPSVLPTINPNYFLIDFDLEVQIAIAKWTRSFWLTSPISDFATESSPGFDALPLNATASQWRDYITTTCKC